MSETRLSETAPCADLVRMLPIARAELRLDEPGGDGEEGVLVGYAAVFNDWAEIDSFWEGHFRERIEPKAFAKTLKERGEKVKVLFNHGFDPSIGDKPLGKPIRQEEDDRGLYVEVPLDDTSYNRDLKASLRSGAIDGMSFRFSVTKQEWNEDTEDGIPERTIKEVRLFEYGPVTFPAYEATEAGIRSLAEFREWRTHRQEEAASTPDVAASTPEEGAASTTEEAASTSLDSLRMELYRKKELT